MELLFAMRVLICWAGARDTEVDSDSAFFIRCQAKKSHYSNIQKSTIYLNIIVHIYFLYYT